VLRVQHPVTVVLDYIMVVFDYDSVNSRSLAVHVLLINAGGSLVIRIADTDADRVGRLGILVFEANSQIFHIFLAMFQCLSGVNRFGCTRCL